MDGMTVNRFLTSDGYGDGSGHGDGYGYGYGYGYGSGSGAGYGYGYGYGSGSGILSICDEPVYLIDGIQTILHKIRGNIAKGETLDSDLSRSPCYVVKQGHIFAHGETIREAMDALREKLFHSMPEADRIDAFVSEHELGVCYPNTDFFKWHHRLTGSCEMGRKAFARDHGIDLDASMTVEEFIALTKDAYGGRTIQKLAAEYKIDPDTEAHI